MMNPAFPLQVLNATWKRFQACSHGQIVTKSSPTTLPKGSTKRRKRQPVIRTTAHSLTKPTSTKYFPFFGSKPVPASETSRDVFTNFAPIFTGYPFWDFIPVQG